MPSERLQISSFLVNNIINICIFSMNLFLDESFLLDILDDLFFDFICYMYMIFCIICMNLFLIFVISE